jgi:hypothetical protein
MANGSKNWLQVLEYLDILNHLRCFLKTISSSHTYASHTSAYRESKEKKYNNPTSPNQSCLCTIGIGSKNWLQHNIYKSPYLSKRL